MGGDKTLDPAEEIGGGVQERHPLGAKRGELESELLVLFFFFLEKHRT